MAELACVRMIWDRGGIGGLALPGFHAIHLAPEAEHPHGRRGAAMAGSWRQLSRPGTDGMLTLDGDVAIDLIDLAAARAAVSGDPSRVWTAPVRLWPRATGFRGWTWGHWRGQPGQELTGDPDRFSLGFTYLPRPLLELPALRRWTYPRVDIELSRAAARLRIGVSVIPGCWPKHLNF